MNIYVEVSRYGESIGPFFSSPEIAFSHYRERFRDASHPDTVAHDLVAGLVCVQLDDPTAEIEIPNVE